MKTDELIVGSLKTLDLNVGASLKEVHKAYFDKILQKRFQRIVWGNETLENDFLRYYSAYINLVKYFSQHEKDIQRDYYTQDQIFNILFNQGIYYLLTDDYVKSGEKFQQAYQIKKTDILVLIYLGIILMKRKSFFVAEKYFVDAAGIDKNNDDAWFYLGENYYQMGKFEKALVAYNTVKSLNPMRFEVALRIKELKKTLAELSQQKPRPKKSSLVSRLRSKLKKEK